MAAAYLAASYPGELPAGLAVKVRNEQYWGAITSMAARGVNAPLTSSAGRLFDAIAALVGVRDAINYEGQAAIELEQVADTRESGSYAASITREAGELRVAGADLVRAASEDLVAGVSVPVIAARFHNGVAGAVQVVCAQLREQTGIGVVALSGGVFQNVLLTNRVGKRLSADGFRVLVHRRVPCNDGGISLGQAAVAGARDRLALGL
jgi:hydrogenase maturation protein HypF